MGHTVKIALIGFCSVILFLGVSGYIISTQTYETVILDENVATGISNYAKAVEEKESLLLNGDFYDKLRSEEDVRIVYIYNEEESDILNNYVTETLGEYNGIKEMEFVNLDKGGVCWAWQQFQESTIPWSLDLVIIDLSGEDYDSAEFQQYYHSLLNKLTYDNDNMEVWFCTEDKYLKESITDINDSRNIPMIVYNEDTIITSVGDMSEKQVENKLADETVMDSYEVSEAPLNDSINFEKPWLYYYTDDNESYMSYEVEGIGVYINFVSVAFTGNGVVYLDGELLEVVNTKSLLAKEVTILPMYIELNDGKKHELNIVADIDEDEEFGVRSVNVIR